MLIAVIGVAALAIVGLWLWLLRRRRPAPAIVSAPAAPGPRRGCSAIHDVRFEPPFNDIEPYAVETPPGVELDLDAAGPAVDGVELRPLRAWLDEAPLDPEIALGLAVGVAGLYALEERDFGPRSIDADDNAPRALDAVIDALEAGRAGDDVVVAIGTPELVLTSVADRVSRNISAVTPTGPVITPAEILFWALFGQSWASWQANPVGGEVLGLPSIERVLCGALLGPSRYRPDSGESLILALHLAALDHEVATASPLVRGAPPAPPAPSEIPMPAASPTPRIYEPLAGDRPSPSFKTNRPVAWQSAPRFAWPGDQIVNLAKSHPPPGIQAGIAGGTARMRYGVMVNIESMAIY